MRKAALPAPLMLVLALTLALASPALAKVRAPTAPLPLHATRGAEPGIFDSRGSEVLLRGVNVNQLGDYYEANPAWPVVERLRRSDFRRIAGLGFNSVRLLMSWSRLEPERGVFDRAYIDRIRRAVGWASRYGLHVVLDMHQDAWGKYIATPPEEVCPPGGRRSAAGTERRSGRRSPAASRPATSACARRRPRSAPPGRPSTRTARASATSSCGPGLAWPEPSRREPAVAGYDLLNEPNPGTVAGNDTTVLGGFYGDAIDAIRKAESSRRRGFEHIVFFEPGILWSAVGSYLTPPPDFTEDENIVFAPHIYAESISPNTIESGFASAR